MLNVSTEPRCEHMLVRERAENACTSHDAAWCSPPTMIALALSPCAMRKVATGPAAPIPGTIIVDLATGIIQVDLATGKIQVEL